MRHPSLHLRSRGRGPSPARLRFAPAGTALLLALCCVLGPLRLAAQDNADCLACHEDKSLTGSKRGKTLSMFVDARPLGRSAHAKLFCWQCHKDADPANLPHEDDLKPVDCAECPDAVAALQQASLHGRAAAKGDPLAPRCVTCHGKHDIPRVKDPNSPVRPARIPFLCGGCHSEGSPVSRQRNIHEDHILENYSESIHGEGLMKKGLTVSATCVSCHTPHSILPHTDPKSSIARRNISATCANCHSQIEQVHRKVIRGELWEKEAHVLPSCPDCHQPHKVRRVFYDEGMANKDCLRCHQNPALRAADGRSIYVGADKLARSMHKTVACSQCHSDVTQSHTRPCDTASRKRVTCAACHAQVVDDYGMSIHGKLEARADANAPRCVDCHGSHEVLGKRDPASRTFPTRVPQLCGTCHLHGQKAAMRRVRGEKDIVEHYTESIHGRGLLRSGLVVTATCTGCHSTHRILPSKDPLSTVNKRNIASTCGRCHHGIEEQFNRSVHSPVMSTAARNLPACSDCHSAHTIKRADSRGFKLEIMDQCGRCHAKIAETYFDTYHGKVTQLGYTKTAKCYDCHGAHNILPVGDPRSSLHRNNVVQTCKKCHPGATRRFAGYLTHATHHDPDKYPFLFWVFWGMTGLLIVTFVVSGLHTLLWLPRSFQWRREIREEEERERLSHVTRSGATHTTTTTDGPSTASGEEPPHAD